MPDLLDTSVRLQKPAVVAPSRVCWRLLVLLALVTCAQAPFLHKAFHIDDAFYITVARQILHEPLNPFGGDVHWDRGKQRVWESMNHPPLWPYLMAGVMVRTGASELALHLLVGVFSLAAAAGLYLLSRRFSPLPMVATVLVVLGPAMLPGRNVMLEAPTMAFALWAIWCHLEAVDGRGKRYTWGAAILTACGIMTKYTTLVVLALLVFASLRRRRWNTLWFLAGPVLALTVWSLWTLHCYGEPHPWTVLAKAQGGDGFSWWKTWGRGFAMLRIIGAVTLLCLPMLLVLRRSGGRRFLAVTFLALLLGLFGTWDMLVRLELRGRALPTHSFPLYDGRIHAAVFGTTGSIVVLGLLFSFSRRPSEGGDEGEVLLWVWWLLVVLFGLFAVPFLAPRHFLPAIPPLVWLTFRRLMPHRSATPDSTTTAWIGATCLLTVALGLAVADADRRFADWYRQCAMRRGAQLVEQASDVGVNVWFVGRWGWSYYARKAGIQRLVPGTNAAELHDILLYPSVLPKHSLENEPMDLVIHRILEPSTPNPLRTVAPGVHYYSDATVNLPYSLSDDAMARLVVARVDKWESVEQETVVRFQSANCGATTFVSGRASGGDVSQGWGPVAAESDEPLLD